MPITINLLESEYWRGVCEQGKTEGRTEGESKGRSNLLRRMRVYSYPYHVALALLLLAISGVAIGSNSHTMKLDMLPWKGAELTHWLFFGSLAGLLTVLLAITGIFRYLFPVWALVVLVMMVRGFLLQPYSFAGRDQFYAVLWLIAGSLGAFLASLTLLKGRKR